MANSCGICGHNKGLLFLTDEFSEQSSISDALLGCFNIQFLDRHCEEDIRICKKCIARLKFCCSFRKDVERAHRSLYGHYFIDNAFEIKNEDHHNEQYENNREYIESYNNDDHEINNQYESQTGCVSDVEDSPYRSDWSQDTDDILTHTGYNREVELINTKKKFEIPSLNEDTTTCPVCGKTFSLHSTLVRHHTAHFPTHQCHFCGNLHSSTTSLNLHMTSHYGSTYECSRCLKTFKNNVSLSRHIQKVHFGIGKLSCKICKERFKEVKAKVKHLVEVHQMESSKFQCLYCKFRYITSGEYRSHLKEEHFDVHNIKCEECSLVFFSRHELNNHNAKHIDLKDYKCKFCDKEFARQRNYKQHLKTHLKRL